MSLHSDSPKTQLVEYLSGPSFEVKFVDAFQRVQHVCYGLKKSSFCVGFAGKPDLLWGSLIFWRALRLCAVILPGLSLNK